MNAIKAARKQIFADPTSDASRALARLVLALEAEAAFDITSLYSLDLNSFELAIDILKEWRIDRYYAGKGKLLDLSYQVHLGAAN